MDHSHGVPLPCQVTNWLHHLGELREELGQIIDKPIEALDTLNVLGFGHIGDGLHLGRVRLQTCARQEVFHEGNFFQSQFHLLRAKDDAVV